MEHDLTKVKERIAKLLSMAKDASSPNEAAIAAQRARALMDKYQLDEYDISEAAPVQFGESDATRAFSAMPYHVEILSSFVGRYNDCQAVLTPAEVTFKMASKANQSEKKGTGRTKSWGKKIVFRGYEADAQMAADMLNRLLENIDSLCKKYMQEYHSGRYNVRIGGEYKTGCALQLIAQFKLMLTEREQLTVSNGTALVVLKMAAVNEHYAPPTKQNDRNKKWNEDGQSAHARQTGYIDGHKIEIIKRLDD